ncbi:hypothetical protein SAMN05216405_4012 [Lachnospiraceae bacterium NLAE-zl-G231]|nr:hypothetical protein SAMN05216405_4012 [Lachnospiraceae bacterium NLAE-zl-G231]
MIDQNAFGLINEIIKTIGIYYKRTDSAWYLLLKSRIEKGEIDFKDELFLSWFYYVKMNPDKKIRVLVEDNIDYKSIRWLKDKVVIPIKLTPNGRRIIYKLFKNYKCNNWINFTGGDVYIKLEDACDGKKVKSIKGILNSILFFDSLRLINYGNPYKFKRYNKKISLYEKKINEYGLSVDDFTIVSSGVLGVWGMREPTDIDFISIEKNCNLICDKLIDSHHHVLNTYGKSREDIVINPYNYFYWKDIKFAIPSIILKACLTRKEKTKEIDGELIYFIEQYGNHTKVDNIQLYFIKIKSFFYIHKRFMDEKINKLKITRDKFNIFLYKKYIKLKDKIYERNKS